MSAYINTNYMAEALDKMVADLKKHIAEYEESKMPIKRIHDIHDDSSMMDDSYDYAINDHVRMPGEVPPMPHTTPHGPRDLGLVDGDAHDIITRGSIGDIARLVNAIALGSGWWNRFEDHGFPTTVMGATEKLLMIHAEVSESVEDLRVARDDMDLVDINYLDPKDSNKPCGFATELADIIIRTLDLAEWLGIDIEDALVRKISYNQTREFRHGDKNL